MKGLVSEAKLIANRANAQKSTGPRTPKGKAWVKRNALRHGIFASEVLIRTGEGAEEAAAFAALLSALRVDLAPSGALEELLVEKLAVIVWRWRRLLRYEVGAIRRWADEAVTDWRKQQYELYLLTKPLREKFHNPYLTPPKWTHTEDLEAEFERARARAEALAEADPLASPHEALVWVLAEACEREDLDVKQLLGLQGEGDWSDCDLGKLDGQAPARLFDALCKAWGTEPGEAWERLRARQRYELEDARKALEIRQRAEERVRMLAALPDAEALEKVVRYEAHLAREFARTLEQLEKAKALKAFGMVGLFCKNDLPKSHINGL